MKTGLVQYVFCISFLLYTVSFLRAAITKCYRPGGLKDQNCILSQFRGTESERRLSAGLVPSRGSEGEYVPGLSPGTGGCWQFLELLGLWQHMTFVLMSLCLSVSLLCLGGHQSYWT